MEQDAQEKMNLPEYKIFWHQNIDKDFEKIPASVTESIIRATESKLSLYPSAIGQPLKGTTAKLWRVTYSKYRIVYTIRGREVWILSVMKREIVYRDAHIQSLLKMAMAIQEKIDESK